MTQPVSYLELNSPDLEASTQFFSGETVVVPPFELTGVGRGCYVVDPGGLLMDLHSYSG